MALVNPWLDSGCVSCFAHFVFSLNYKPHGKETIANLLYAIIVINWKKIREHTIIS